MMEKVCICPCAFRFCSLQESNSKIAALTKSLAKLDPSMVPKVDLEQYVVEGRFLGGIKIIKIIILAGIMMCVQYCTIV